MTYDDVNVVVVVVSNRSGCGLFYQRSWKVKILLESVIRISLPKYIVRVWRQEEQDYEHMTRGVSDVELEAYRNQDMSAKALALSLLMMPNVNAVEILDWENKGLVCYSDRP